MATGRLPEDGELRLGSVLLPAGRRILPLAGPAEPVAWVTTHAVPEPGRVWSVLSARHTETGLVPVLLADDPVADSEDFFFYAPADVSGVDHMDAAQVLAKLWEDKMSGGGEGEPRRMWDTPLTRQFLGLASGTGSGNSLADIVGAIVGAATDPSAAAELDRLSELDRLNAARAPAGAKIAAKNQDPGGGEPGTAAHAPAATPFPGLAPPEDSKLSAARLDGVLAALPPARVGLVAARRPADVLPVVGWSCGDDGWFYEGLSLEPVPNTIWIAAVLRSWEDRFGARLLNISPDDGIRLLVERPPRSLQSAEPIAAEHYCFADECDGCGRSDVATISASLVNEPIWQFWWD